MVGQVGSWEQEVLFDLLVYLIFGRQTRQTQVCEQLVGILSPRVENSLDQHAMFCSVHLHVLRINFPCGPGSGQQRVENKLVALLGPKRRRQGGCTSCLALCAEIGQ